MIIKPKFLPTKMFFGNFGTGYNNPLPFDAGTWFTTPIIDRSLTPTFAEHVELVFITDTAEATGNVEAYVYSDFLGNDIELPGLDAKEPSVVYELTYVGAVHTAKNAVPKWELSENPSALSLNLKKAGEFTVTGNTYSTVSRFSFNVASVLGGVVPRNFAIVCKNGTTGSITGYAHEVSGAWCQVTGVQAETV